VTGFDVLEYRIEGNTRLPRIAVERAVLPHLGRARTLADVERAREALEQAYHGAGYLTVVVAIPPQRVDAGVVRLQVTEAPVERLRIVGARHFLPSQVRAGAPEVAEGQVPNFQDFQAELVALNRHPDRRVTPVLRPGRTPGTVEIDLRVQDELPLHGSVSLDDRHSRDTTRTRLAASLRWDNLWARQHSLGLTVQTAPQRPKDSRVLSLNYTLPLAGGSMLALYGVRSDSDVTALGELQVLGRGLIVGLRVIHPLPSREGSFHSLSAGLDYKDFDQDVALIGAGGFASPIEYLPFTLGWDASWFGGQRSTRAGVSANFHFGGLVGDPQQFADKRFRGRPSYFYLRGHASHERGDAAGAGLTLRLRWQLADQALIANEQFVIGGADSVRGYYESAAVGDRGLSASVELRSANLLRRAAATAGAADPAAAASAPAPSPWRLQARAFVDAGTVEVIDPITAQSHFTLASAGLGLSLNHAAAGAGRGLDASLYWAYPLRAAGATERGDHRLHFSLSYDW
jgi:hemolysin activation/secretion protein